MTPEQLAEFLNAIRQQNWILVTGGALWLAVALIHLWLAKRIEAAIANRQHFSRLRYERELEVYREAWSALVKLQEATHLLKPGAEEAIPNETEEDRRRRKLKAFSGAFNELLDATRNHRPFYPLSVWKEFSELLKFADQQGIEFRFPVEPKSFDEFHQTLMSSRERLNQCIMTIELAIRARLDEFDGH